MLPLQPSCHSGLDGDDHGRQVQQAHWGPQPWVWEYSDSLHVSTSSLHVPLFEDEWQTGLNSPVTTELWQGCGEALRATVQLSQDQVRSAKVKKATKASWANTCHVHGAPLSQTATSQGTEAIHSGRAPARATDTPASLQCPCPLISRCSHTERNKTLGKQSRGRWVGRGFISVRAKYCFSWTFPDLLWIFLCFN